MKKAADHSAAFFCMARPKSKPRLDQPAPSRNGKEARSDPADHSFGGVNNPMLPTLCPPSNPVLL